MELVFKILPGPLEDLHDPVCLVIIRGVSEDPRLDHNNAVGYETGEVDNRIKGRTLLRFRNLLFPNISIQITGEKCSHAAHHVQNGNLPRSVRGPDI